MTEERSPIEIVRVSVGELTGEVITQAASLLRILVAQGAALGWVEPPSAVEVESLLREIVGASMLGDAFLVVCLSFG